MGRRNIIDSPDSIYTRQVDGHSLHLSVHRNHHPYHYMSPHQPYHHNHYPVHLLDLPLTADTEVIKRFMLCEVLKILLI